MECLLRGESRDFPKDLGLFGDLRFLFPWNEILKIPSPGNTSKVVTSEITSVPKIPKSFSEV